MPYYKVDQPGLYMYRIQATAEHMASTYTNYEYLGPDPDSTNKTEFSPKELYNSFTPDEILLAKVNSDPAIVAQAALLAEGRDVVINSTDAGYQSAIDRFEAAGVITADRAADYRQGIPLEV